MENNYDLRTLRLKRGVGLEEIANSINRLSLSRLCKFEDKITEVTIYVRELFEIAKLLNLNDEETDGFLHWAAAHYKNN